MARKQPRFQQVYLQHSLEQWFRDRQRVFVYHYRSQPEVDADWRDLSSTGCSYRGWAVLSNFHRGEIWTYATSKHLMLVRMLVSSDSLILREDWRQLMREKVRKERMYRDQIRRVVKHPVEQHTWWDEDK